MALKLVSESPGHDLPPRWDGYAVAWLGWTEHTGTMFICGEPEFVCESCGRGDYMSSACERCGSNAPPLSNLGLVSDDPELTVDDLMRNHEAVSLAHRTGRHRSAPDRLGWIRLSAFRCPDCQLDTVVVDGETVWTLDEDDYGDEGSVA